MTTKDSSSSKILFLFPFQFYLISDLLKVNSYPSNMLSFAYVAFLPLPLRSQVIEQNNILFYCLLLVDIYQYLFTHGIWDISYLSSMKVADVES
jgi:hypothetical protein